MEETTRAPEAGGADWEIGEAARKFSLALGLDDERAAAVTAAMSDHAAAVGSKSTQMIAGLFTRLFEAIEATRTDVATLAGQREKDRLSARLEFKTFAAEMRQGQDFLTDEVKRFTNRVDTQVDRIWAAVDSQAQKIDQLVAGQASLTARLEELDTRGQAHYSESMRDRAGLRDRLAHIEQQLDARPGLEEIERLKAMLFDHERRLTGGDG